MKRLFIDNQHIQVTFGLRRTFHEPIKHPEPVLAPERPWEDCQVRIDTSPMWDAERGRWRMWYNGGRTLLPLYAESSDGLNWERPELGRVDWQGTTANNVVNRHDVKTQEEASPIPHSLMFRDDQETDPARRFKGFAWFRQPEAAHYLKPFVSANGFDWSLLEGADRIPSEDTKQCAHDTLCNRYVLTVKGLSGCGVKRYGAAELGRIVYLSLSEDFLHWSEPELIFHADQIDQELGRQRIEAALADPDRRHPAAVRPEQFFTDVYFLPVFVYEDLYLGLPIMFNQSGAFFGPHGTNQDGLLAPTLVSSRNLRDWDRLSRTPLLSHSRLSDPHLFDHACIYPTPPVRNGNELWFYYHGARYSHINPGMIDELKPRPDEPTTGIFLARMRADGFASLDAGAEAGELLTRAVVVTGPRLYLNANAAWGEIKVELRDAVTGRGIAGFSMGDYRGSRILKSEDGKRGRLRVGAGARFLDDPETDDTVPVSTDATRIEVQWKSGADLSDLKGREVRLFVQIRQAQLFAFWFA